MMIMSLHLNPKISSISLAPNNIGIPKNNFKTIKPISCRANTYDLATHHSTKSNFYQLLSLGSEKVGLDEIKKAYRSMALLYHPDVCPPSAREESTRRFVELQKAYKTLSDPISRRQYDYELGFRDSTSCGTFVHEHDENSSNAFPRIVWEQQLSQLRERSRQRMERNKKGKM